MYFDSFSFFFSEIIAFFYFGQWTLFRVSNMSFRASFNFVQVRYCGRSLILIRGLDLVLRSYAFCFLKKYLF